MCVCVCVCVQERSLEIDVAPVTTKEMAFMGLYDRERK